MPEISIGNPYIYAKEIHVFYVSEIMEGLYERLNRPDRPNRKTMRSMSVGDIIQIDGKELFFCDSVGFKKISFAGTGELVLKAGKENSEKGK